MQEVYASDNQLNKYCYIISCIASACTFYITTWLVQFQQDQTVMLYQQHAEYIQFNQYFYVIICAQDKFNIFRLKKRLDTYRKMLWVQDQTMWFYSPRTVPCGVKPWPYLLVYFLVLLLIFATHMWFLSPSRCLWWWWMSFNVSTAAALLCPFHLVLWVSQWHTIASWGTRGFTRKDGLQLVAYHASSSG